MSEELLQETLKQLMKMYFKQNGPGYVEFHLSSEAVAAGGELGVETVVEFYHE